MTGELEQLRQLKVKELARGAISQEMAPALVGQISLTERDALGRVIGLLSSPEVDQLIADGKLSIGMIKPDLTAGVLENQLNSETDTDASLLDKIKAEIEPPLEVVFDISLTFSPEQVDEFYDGKPRQQQEQVEPYDAQRYGRKHQSRWDEFRALMVNGPATFLLIYHPQGEAVKEWRQQMGNNWDVDQVRQDFPDSLRAKWAKDTHNNIAHGSDSQESVKRELRFLIKALTELLDK